MFLPLCMQLVLGISATHSGFTRLPRMAGLITTISGLIVLLLGVLLLISINLDTTRFGLAWRMIIVGLGLGPAQSLVTLALQNAVPVTQLGIATSASQLFWQIGLTTGLAVFGSLLALSVGHEIPKCSPKSSISAR